MNNRFVIISIIAILLITGVFMVVKIVTTDGRINPFAFGNAYKVKFAEILPESGKSEIEMLKDRPEVRFKKWNGEVDMGVSYKKVEAKAEKSFFSNKVEWKGGNEEVHAYPIQTESGIKNGEFEIEVILNEKPITNKFNFNIDGAEELDFFYQPPLDKGNNVGKRGIVSCSDTKCMDKNGKQILYRPENVVGSYAVYHKEKKDHILGQTNYGTGKVFHIFRPKAIDANGKEQWAVLNYENNILSVTVPQDFLDKAAYPVIVDPTIGYTGTPASYDDTDNYILATKFTAPADGNASPGTMYAWLSEGSVGTVTAYGGVYADGDADPFGNSLLSNSAVFVTDGATKAKYSSSITWTGITNGTSYWLAINNDTDGNTWFDDSSGTVFYANSTPPGAMPNPFPSGASGSLSGTLGVYVEYSAPSSSPHVKIRGGGAGGPSLINTGLVVRYYLDEASSGTTPTTMLDLGGGTAFNLTIGYGSATANYTETSGNRGWEGTSITGTHIASKAINDTADKVRTALSGMQKGTWEAVIDIHDSNTNYGRVFGMTASAGEGNMMVVIDPSPGGGTYTAIYRHNDNDRHSWLVTANERAVWHAVIDTTQAVAADRFKVYKNGSPVSVTPIWGLTENETLTIPSASSLVIFNRPNLARPMDGVMYYAALYTSAFSSADVTANYNILVSDDDTPVAGSASPSVKIRGGSSGGGSSPTSGLVAYWKLDEGSGTAAADSSGSGNGGTISGATWISGKIGSGLHFDGNDYAYSTSFINLSGTNQVTVSSWLNYQPTTDPVASVFHELTTSVLGSTEGFIAADGNDDECTSQIEIGLQGNTGFSLACYTRPTNGWHHFAVVYDKSLSTDEVSFYIDGVLKTPASRPYNSNNTNNFANDYFVLMSRAGSEFFATGDLDEVRVYNYALSGQDILNIYNDLPKGNVKFR